MIQFNLLPDVKLAYAKAQRTKRTVMGLAIILTAASLGLFVLLFLSVNVVQKKNIGDLNDDIKQYSNELKNTTDLNKILTIQHQLGAMSSLHDSKVVASRAPAIMQQVTPADVTISDLAVDYVLGVITVTGQAPSLDRVNTFVDTLKFTTFGTDEEQGKKAFNKVVMSQFSRSDNETSYTITASFDSGLFSGANSIAISVPKTVTTRSVVQQPTEIFKQPAAAAQQGTR